jgi:uncharacterized protein YkwD
MRVLLLALPLVILSAFAAPSSADAAPSARMSAVESRMLSAINAARSRHGLRPLRAHARLTRSSRSYARHMIRRNRWAHPSRVRVPGFGSVGEILGRMPGRSAKASPIVEMWLRSPVHRRELLRPSYRRVGVASAVGRMGARTARVWVVRFAR